MLKLIVWLVVVFLVYRVWKGLRAKRDGAPAVRGRKRERKVSRFDRSQVVDAEFQEIDEEDDKA